MPIEEPLERFTAGRSALLFSSDKQNQRIDRLTDLTRELNALQPAIGQLGDRPRDQLWVGKIKTTGPVGTEDDRTGNEYWVQRQHPKTGQLSTDPLEWEEETTPGLKATVIASNIGEDLDSHSLAEDTFVVVQVQFVASNPPVVRYWFNPGGSGKSIVKITSAGTGTGNYNGSVCSGPVTTVADFSDIVAGADCLIRNLIEANSALALPAGWYGTGAYAMGTSMGTDADSGLPIYYVETFKLFVCP